MQKEIIGYKRTTEISEILHQIHVNSVLFFHGQQSFENHRLLFEQLLSDYSTIHYSNIKPNPKYEQIQDAIDKFKGTKFDAIIAFGGGSVIDFAKAFRFYSNIKTPLFAIPTTAGTGSEATQFAVVYINGIKNSLDDPTILPDYAILDSQFTEKAPQYIKACSAIDAYCQAMESYWSVRSTKESLKYAKQAIMLINDSIEKFVLLSDMNAAEKMMLASHLSGMAINISRTTAAHALSYTITTQYGIPHGHAVALSMPDLVHANFNVSESNCRDSRGVSFVRAKLNDILYMIGIKTPDEFTEYWHKLMDKLGMEWRIDKLGIRNTQNIINGVNKARLANNPVDIMDTIKTFYQR